MLNSILGTRVNIEQYVDGRVDAKMTRRDLLILFSNVRQGIANSVAVAMKILLESKFKLKLDGGRIVTVANDSLAYGAKLNICKSGYSIHETGYLCSKYF